MDTLADEYDPIRSLDAFGMHLIEDNPGVKEALSAREHSIAIQQNKPEPEPAQRGEAAGATTSDVQSQAQTPSTTTIRRRTRATVSKRKATGRMVRQNASPQRKHGGVRWAAAANAIRKVSE